MLSPARSDELNVGDLMRLSSYTPSEVCCAGISCTGPWSSLGENDYCWGCMMQHPNEEKPWGNAPAPEGKERRFTSRFCDCCYHEGLKVPLSRVKGVPRGFGKKDRNDEGPADREKGKKKLHPWDRNDGENLCCKAFALDRPTPD